MRYYWLLLFLGYGLLALEKLSLAGDWAAALAIPIFGTYVFWSALQLCKRPGGG